MGSWAVHMDFAFALFLFLGHGVFAFDFHQHGVIILQFLHQLFFWRDRFLDFFDGLFGGGDARKLRVESALHFIEPDTQVGNLTR